MTDTQGRPLHLIRRVGSVLGLLVLLILPVAGAWLLREVTHLHGAGLSPDSVNYLYMAQQLVAGNGFVTIDPTLVPSWSPGYSVMLALIAGLTGGDPFQFAHWVNLVLFACTILLTGYIGWHTMGAWSPLMWAAAATVALSDDLLSIYAMAWSEPLFIVPTLLLFIALQQYRTQSNNRNLFILTVLGAGVCLARYSGVVAVPVAGLSILIWGQGTWRRRLGHGMVFVIGSLLPVALWMLRNSLATGTAMGERFPSQMPLKTNLTLTAQTLLSWYLDDGVAATLRVLVVVTAMAGVALAAFGVAWWLANAKAKQYWHDHGMMVLFSVAYTGFIIVSATQVHFDPINHRLLAPVLIPLTLSSFGLVQLVIQSLPHRLLQAGAAVAAVGMAGLVVGQQQIEAQQFVIANREQGVEGIGHVQWEKNQTLTYFQAMTIPESAAVYSPYLELLYYRTGRIGSRVPRRGTTLSELQGTWPPTPGYFIWFHGAEYSFPAIEELAVIATLSEVAKFEDGAIFRIERK